MSLLIKALDKAEQGKKAEEQTNSSVSELSLEPVTLEDGISSSSAIPSGNDDNGSQLRQQAASTVFAAKQPVAKPGSSKNIMLIAAIGLFVMLFIGFQIYNYIQDLSKPALIMPRPVATVPVEIAQPQTLSQKSQQQITEQPAAPQSEITAAEPALAQVSQPPSQDIANNKIAKLTKPEPMLFGEPVKETNTPLQVTKNNLDSRVNPDLMAAYRAFNASDDTEAQELYRKVLRSDIRNIDALLGMASIAQRQGRNQDAMGWYGKVLELEPRNSIAQAAMANTISQADPVSTESRIKNLLAQQPAAAHLHEALGNIYAERNQWPAAQQSYFEAHRLEPVNPEYAFNLAISLDQLGKPSLALEYYKKTLELIQRTSNTTIDRNQLESRISQLQ